MATNTTVAKENDREAQVVVPKEINAIHNNSNKSWMQIVITCVVVASQQKVKY